MNSVAFFEIEDWEKEYLKERTPDASFLFTDKKVQEETNEEMFQAEILSPFIYSELSKENLEKFPNLKMIATRSTGFDHIDLDYCKEKGIIVCNVPSYGAHAVAEHTFALLLAISRKIVPTVEQSRRGNYELKGLAGFDLAGKTMGVIGTGKIGGKVIQLARAFEMKVLVYTHHPEEFAGQEGISSVPLEELLKQADVVTLHLPHTPQTHHIINHDNIKLFKKGSVLLNTARGPLVETQAILEGLESGILSGAGLDVLEEECNLKEERELLHDEYVQKCDLKTQLMDHVLINRDDVLFTSHNGFHSKEAVRQILDVSAENIEAFIKGSPQNVVAKE